jgi:Protein of unknown function (DUF2794)
MSEDDSQFSPELPVEDRSGNWDKVVPLPAQKYGGKPVETVRFDRRELDQILRIYSMMVGAGDWRDYAIDHLKDRAVFSVFRRASEFPLYRIEKNPRLARRQGAYSVIATSGKVLKRGHELANVLRVFDKPLRVVASN